MKNHRTFAAWAADRPAKLKPVARALRALVKKRAPSLTETVKWGNGAWIGEEWPVLFLHGKDDHLQFGFFSGSELDDPAELLEGSGKYVKHIKVYTLADIREAAFARLIRQAVKFERS